MTIWLENWLSLEEEIFQFECMGVIFFVFQRINLSSKVRSIVHKNKKNTSLEIQHRIILPKGCYFALNKQLKSEVLSWWTKSKFHNSLIILVLLFGAEAWTMTATDDSELGVIETDSLFCIALAAPQMIDQRAVRIIRWYDQLANLVFLEWKIDRSYLI